MIKITLGRAVVEASLEEAVELLRRLNVLDVPEAPKVVDATEEPPAAEWDPVRWAEDVGKILWG